MTEYRINLGSGRAAATAIRNLADRETDEGTKQAVLSIAHQLEEQVKPAIEEPQDFGSVVRAGIDGISDRVLWLRSASGYWFSETSRRATFSDFHEPEVLRVGVGDEAAYNNGVSDTVSALVARLLEKRAGTNLMQKRDAFTDAIKIAEAMS